MTTDKEQTLANLTPRQKLTAGIFLIVLLIIIWQLIGLFSGRGKTQPSSSVNMAQTGVSKSQSPGPEQMRPHPAELPKTASVPASSEEIQMAALQQAMQAKYLEAINELQMLKVSREIAEANRAIMTAKLATVTAQNNIINLLDGPNANRSGQKNSAPVSLEVKYTATSVSQLQYKWSAILNYRDSLYNVQVGDVLPPDGSTVVAIDKTGVMLEKDGIKKKISLVSII
jgi:hypothetical protein